MCRNWKKRIKGRDLYDFEFYIKNDCLLNIKHLEQRMIQTGYLSDKEMLSQDIVKELLKSKFKEIDFEQAKKDVLPFINNSSKLNVWCLEYFNYLVEQLTNNTITVYFRNFDLSEYGKNKILNEEIIDNISFSSKAHKNNIWKELKIKFNRYIVLDNEIFNFDNKTEKLDSYYVIEGFDEIMYLKKNVDIVKVIATLKY